MAPSPAARRPASHLPDEAAVKPPARLPADVPPVTISVPRRADDSSVLDLSTGASPTETEVALVDALPDDLDTRALREINTRRTAAGLAPVQLDARSSAGCREHARYLARNAPFLAAHGLSRHNEDPALPGHTDAGLVAARSATVADRDPLAALGKWLAGPAHRALLLRPTLRTVSVGYAQNVRGQWVSVFDWSGGQRSQTASWKGGVILYPAPGQGQVPLLFPGNEIPDPLPEARDKVGGYPVTATFPRRIPVKGVEAWLEDEAGDDVAVWLSSPEKPANKRHVAVQQNTVCLIARQPLQADTCYTVKVRAAIATRTLAWTWSFTTLSNEELRREMDDPALARLNAYRQKAGLEPVQRDADRSRGCAAHAAYLARNLTDRPEAVYTRDEDPRLPGYSRQGRAVARTAIIRQGARPERVIDAVMESALNRNIALDPGLRTVGLGYAMHAGYGWIWVVDLLTPRVPSDRTAPVLFPGDGQKDVPLTYPAETPSMVPAEARGKKAGYAVTAIFRPGTPVSGAKGRLEEDSGREVEVWLSSPERPAIPGVPQRMICLLPRAPLRPGVRYTVTLAALVRGETWRQTWSFTTEDPEAGREEHEQEVLQAVNTYRQAAGLPPCTLDARLSRASLLHARYLVANADHPAAQGLGMHSEDPSLPGATPEGARAGKAGLITNAALPADSVATWMDTFYHRVPLLSPDLKRIGFGAARLPNGNWVSVLDYGEGKETRSPRKRPAGG